MSDDWNETVKVAGFNPDAVDPDRAKWLTLTVDAEDGSADFRLQREGNKTGLAVRLDGTYLEDVARLLARACGKVLADEAEE